MPLRALVALLALVLLPSATPAQVWESVGPEGGPVRSFTQSPSNPERCYVHPHGLGVYRSEDGGESWSRVDEGLPVDVAYGRLAVSPVAQDLVLMIRPGGILRTTDGGVTWSEPQLAGAFVHDIKFDPHDPTVALLTARAGTEPGIHRSTDAGATWSLLNDDVEPSSLRSLEFHPGVPNIVLLTHLDGISRSTDGGNSWVQVYHGDIPARRTTSFCRADPVRVWSSGVSDFLRSDDGGVTFLEVESPGYANLLVAADPVDPDVVVAGLYDEVSTFSPSTRAVVRRSTDGGQTWATTYESDAGQHEDHLASELTFHAVLPNVAYLAVEGDCRDGILRSTDAGQTWAPKIGGIRALRVLAIERDAAGTPYLRSAQQNGLYRTDVPGDPWELEAPHAPFIRPASFDVGEFTAGVVHEVSTQVGFDTVFAMYSRSTDAGQSWSTVNASPFDFYLWPTLLSVDQAAGQGIYIWFGSGVASYLLRSENGGQSFSDDIWVDFDAVCAIVSGADPQRILAIARLTGEFQASTDGGMSWQSRSSGLPVDEPVALFSDPAELGPGGPSRFLVVYETEGVWETTDSGLSWTEYAAPSPSAVVAADWDPLTGHVYRATESDGVIVPGLGAVMEGLSTRALTDIRFFPSSRSLLLGTDHASVFLLELPSAVPAPRPELAAVSALTLSARPVPFTTAVKLELALPHAGDAEVAIFSVDGRRIRTLFSGPAAVGRQVLEWNARSDAGRPVAPGVYFVRATASGETVTRRVVHLPAR